MDYFLLAISIYGSAKKSDEKKKSGRANFGIVSLAHRFPQAKCQLVQTSCIKRIIFSCLPYNKHLINRA